MLFLIEAAAAVSQHLRQAAAGSQGNWELRTHELSWKAGAPGTISSLYFVLVPFSC